MRHFIFDVPIDDLSDNEFDQQLTEWVNGNTSKFLATPNPEFLLLASKDTEFQKLLQSSDLSLPDGVGLRFAIAALTDERLHHRHTGVDLVDRLAYLSYKTNRHLLLVGGEEGAAKKTKQYFEQKYPGVRISVFNPGRIDLHYRGTHEGYPYDLAGFNADIMLVALGQKKQEQFIKQALPNLPSVRIAVGVGGAFEMISRMKPRAPQFMLRMGLEWLWRVMIEPSRAGRILNATFVFPIVVVCATLRQHRFWKACRKVIPEIYRQLSGK
ncbi:hypothetical protein A3C09_01890 [Candidatus Uhrbacteria bacterium RIFCSPHIGHO2_02_FULL_47_44]|uniref:Glycosyltransferase n=1 Tax=Candidatus Uhrbacteria bacterium RIFCSPLOWO2_02_FULL_48_18 TaxID=1802408 RepID=A0A1F7VBR5_9BACT|nr:MAG: hypothetical protein A2839_03025 [Candidatus Uhrbacteria bacterium RIFCSPHIGHO2_01_FULL_47_10]OGL70432.1 MAG: hypothetical protein A3C09_01890 [Candidatus Uhrbacteria bacterium RIFCSPHIGHO2_02_FULL_47_44]OGL76877.1 MAG: hypothetical protein A3E97_01885 [Candidatus Uhrbacteria bacterium RIFCSPHIGHO2_12_FULL_47_12]OGL82346.1 MAG: hypothetical protein A3B20_01165 [Candidatus Uhrbacteria bacterium RIFCSPLOWO2_01_FULL_47_17]OGL87992.1 MAG: hypothetical protein A3I41_02695 [Candidatus Uhrbact